MRARKTVRRPAQPAGSPLCEAKTQLGETLVAPIDRRDKHAVGTLGLAFSVSDTCLDDQTHVRSGRRSGRQNSRSELSFNELRNVPSAWEPPTVLHALVGIDNCTVEAVTIGRNLPVRSTLGHRETVVIVSIRNGTMTAMVKSELVGRLAAQFPDLARADADAAVGQILRAIATTLAQGDRVEIRDFGSFSVATRPSRTGRNPKTGEAVAVPARTAPRFKPGKMLRDVVDRG